MRRIILIVLAIMVCAWILWMEMLSSARTNPSVGPGTIVNAASLLDFVPASALLAVEIEGLEQRWEDIRHSPPVAGLQDILFSCAGIRADRMVKVIGNRAVAFLAASLEQPSVTPIAILRPADWSEAKALMAGGFALSHRIAGDTLWIGPPGQEPLLESLARMEGPRFNEVIPIADIHSKLPAGGIIRGYINPAAGRALLLKIMDRTPSSIIQWPIAMLTAELHALRYAAFRREFMDSEVVCDGIAVYEPTHLPPEVLRILNPAASPVAMPAEFPANTLAVLAFRTEAQAWLPWLNYLADSDRHGPLRNLNFWMEEFQARYRHDLNRDLFKPLTGQGWLLLSNQDSDSAELVLVIETSEERKLEATLVDMVSWASEQIWLETLGTVVPKAWHLKDGVGVLHGVTLKTAISEIPGPCFQVCNGYLIAAGSPKALTFGREWVKALKQSRIGIDMATRGLPIHGSLVVQGKEMGKWLRGISRNSSTEFPPCLRDTILILATQLRGVNANMRYELDGIRLGARIHF